MPTYKVKLKYKQEAAAGTMAFLNELMEFHETNPNYTFVGTMTQMEEASRTEEFSGY